MRVLVTGADGFVGRHLCAALRERGDEVHAFGGPTAAGGLPPLEITDPAAVARAVEAARPEAVVHLAGFSSVGKSHQAPALTFTVNGAGALNVLAAVRDGARAARVLLIGSGEMYGAVEPGARAAEDHPLRPLSPYAASKVAAEVVGMQFHRSYGVDVVCARPFNHLGAGQDPSFAVPAFAQQIAAIKAGRAEPVVKVGNLEAVRDFSHVRDVVDAYRLLLERGAAGTAYNVCSGTGRTIRQVLDRMIQLAGVEARVEVEAARVRPADLPSLVGDPSRLIALGWTPQRTVDGALAEALRAAFDQSG
jgi:GDP-4-dehydro-6-deoxy-D-mannose reductase